jgi:hypothetical protein
MRLFNHILCLIVMLSLGLSGAAAQENAQLPPQPKYRLELIYISDLGSQEHIFVVGNMGFKSVESLKKFVGDLPPGSILEWAPGCRRSGGEPLLSSPQDMEGFRAFCVAKQINFILVPSG